MKILFIEPDDKSYEAVCSMLDTIGYSNDNIIRCKILHEVIEVPAENIFVILSVLVLPDSPAADTTFTKVQAIFPYVPVILLITSGEEQVAITTVKEGSQDYLVKRSLDARALSKSIQYAVARKKAANIYKRLFEESPVPMYIFDPKTYDFLFVNDTALLQYQYGREEFLSKKVLDIRPTDDWERFKVISNDIPNEYYDAGRWRHIRKNGEIFFVHVYAHNTMFEGRSAVIVLAIDIDTKVKAEQEIQEKRGRKKRYSTALPMDFIQLIKKVSLRMPTKNLSAFWDSPTKIL